MSHAVMLHIIKIFHIYIYINHVNNYHYCMNMMNKVGKSRLISEIEMKNILYIFC